MEIKYGLILISCIMLLFSCASKPAEVQPDAAAETAVKTKTETVAAVETGGEMHEDDMVVVEDDRAAVPSDADFQKQYDRHRKTLDLTGAKKYTVKKGDTLAKIARTQYHSQTNAYYFPLIMMASSDVVKNPDFIRPGMTLIIPDLEQNLNEPEERANVKAFLIRMADLYEKVDKYPATQSGLRKTAAKL